MKLTPSPCSYIAALLFSAGLLKAQAPSEPGSAESPQSDPALVISTKEMPVVSPELAAMQVAQTARITIATSVAGGAISAEAGLERLRALASPAGQGLSLDAERAAAATDIGLRLLAARRAEEAAAFFLYADASLTAVIAQTADQDAGKKVGYLTHRAFLRAQFLNQAALAKADLDRADRLKPDDPHLQSARTSLSRDKAADFPATPKN